MDMWGSDDAAAYVSCTAQKAGERLTKKGVEEALRRLSEKAGVPTLNPHSMRHLFGVRRWRADEILPDAGGQGARGADRHD